MKILICLIWNFSLFSIVGHWIANILLIGKSLNQTIIMQNIPNELTIHTCMFSPLYADYGLVKWLASRDLLEFTISGWWHKQESLEYISKNWIPIGYGWRNNSHDLVVIGTDTHVPKILGIIESSWCKRECISWKCEISSG